MGKGDTRRPAAIPKALYEDNWRRTFQEVESKIEERKHKKTPQSSSDTSPAPSAAVETTTPSTPTDTPTASDADTARTETAQRQLDLFP